MKITFVSTIDAPAENLTIESYPFVFGRGTPELQDDCSDQVRMLLQHVSRKHATLIEEQGSLYLEDNGSLNGTSINGRKLTDTRVLLSTGDVVLFADKLGYVVELQDEQVPVRNAVVMLVPDQNETGESITITVSPFSLPKEISGNDTGYLKIAFERNQALLLSLTAQSGAMVDGKPVQPGKNFLHHDSVIKFASGLKYRLVCDTGQLRSQSNPASSGNDSVGENTVYMDEATTFMSVFSRVEKDENAKASSTAAKSRIDESVKSTTANVTSLFRTFWKYILAIGVVVTLIVVGVVSYRSTDAYKIQNLYEEKNYRTCLILANDMLAKSNRDKTQNLAQKSFISATIPSYIGMLGEKDYIAIKAELAGYREIMTNVEHSKSAINVLLFIARVHRFFSVEQRELVITDNERKNEISAINEQWKEEKNNYRPVLDEIVQQEPSFHAVVERFFAQLNDNRELALYELLDIKKIEEGIKALIIEQKVSQVRDLISKFHDSHPDIHGEEKWLKDLDRFDLLIKANEEKNLFGLSQVREQASMHTDLFRGLAASYVESNYPDVPAQQVFDQARQFWQSGNPHKATTLLKGLPKGNWQTAIDRETEHMRKLMALVEKVESTRETSTRCKVVAEIYGMALQNDVFYKRLFGDEHIRCRNQASITGKNYLTKANSAFETYRQQGGITGQMRMASVISQGFRTQAQVLTKAHKFAVQAAERIELSSIEMSASDRKVIAEINEEFQLQHSRLQNSTVLSTSLVQQKLSLFKD